MHATMVEAFLKQHTTRKLAVFSTLLAVVSVLVLSFAFHAFAAEATNLAKALTPEKATSYFEQCKEGKLLSCSTVIDDVKVDCHPAVGNGWYCEFVYPDKSKITADPNFFKGSQFKNYDSEGNEVGSTNTGFGGTSEGTLAGSQGLDTHANECSFTHPLQCLLNLPGVLLSAVAFFFLTLCSIFLFFSGVVFNWVVIRTVFQFATYFGTSQGMLIAWGVLRDIGNIALLFGFIFMGIATILNTHSVEGYTARKALPQLIIFAVLLNFSLFASQAVIDVANGFSSVFATYAGQSCDVGASGSSSTQSDSDCANIGISGKILTAVGMNQILPSGDQAVSALSSAWQKPYTYTAMLLLLSVLVAITAVVLLAAAIMLAIRVVVLSLLMVTSPIGFAGMAIPALHGLATDWWHRLINQSFFAPAYLLMVFISLKLVENLMVGNATVSDAIMGNQLAGSSAAGNMQVVMVFIIVIAFMIAALMVAQKMGAYGATFATNAASSIVHGGITRGMNLAAGGIGLALRAGARKRAEALRKQNKEPGMGTLAMMDLGTRLKGANLDTRRLPGVAAALKAGGATTGANVASHATFADMQHQVQDMRSGKKMQQLGDAARRELAVAELENNAHHSEDGSLSKRDKDVLQDMSVKKLEELHGIKEGVSAIAQNLTQEQYDGLQKSDKLTDLEKANLKKAREERFDDMVVEKINVKTGNKLPDGSDEEIEKKVTRAERTLRNMKPADVAALKGSTLAKEHVLKALTGAQLAAIDPEKLSTEEADAFAAFIAKNQTSAEIQKFHSIAGYHTSGAERATRGSNPNASRRWEGYLPRNTHAPAPTPAPTSTSTTAPEQSAQTPNEPYKHVPFNQRERFKQRPQ